MEMADALVITKADGENIKAATLARANYQHALHLVSVSDSGWKPKVLTSSALENTGVAETWKIITDYVQFVEASGYFQENRHLQNRNWFYESIQTQLLKTIEQSEKIKNNLERFEKEIASGLRLPSEAARQLINEVFQHSI